MFFFFFLLHYYGALYIDGESNLQRTHSSDWMRRW